jgi:TerC family integral membrane protein
MPAGSMMAWPWFVFAALVASLLVLDLAVFHRRPVREGMRRALLWSAFWVAIGLAFAIFVGVVLGREAALSYLTAFLVEKALSVDNLFVFLALFDYFAVDEAYQHRVLYWGILGALVSRGVFIVAGVALLTTFSWLAYLLGAILIATGARLGLGKAERVHPERNPVVRWASKVLPMTRSHDEHRFLTRTPRGLRFTPLVLVLLAIETTDIMFAVDSVPAVLAVSRDVFVVYTSNVFAILGLRALYFVLARAFDSLHLLRPALAVILVLIGAKMALSEVVEIPAAWSLAGVGAILAAATVASLVLPRRSGARRRGTSA